jgi:hypothetical protein
LARVEIWCNREIAFRREPSRNIFDMIVESPPFLHNDYSRPRVASSCGRCRKSLDLATVAWVPDFSVYRLTVRHRSSPSEHVFFGAMPDKIVADTCVNVVTADMSLKQLVVQLMNHVGSSQERHVGSQFDPMSHVFLRR